ncbi:NINE protein [Agromyces albus]|uniref:NINE protein n=1 Tax=Agromyces albus TaxID=205332 RepID=A0A4Q2L517_9MICO|nr:NINE protein [Agromyces albus]RXZ72000.1 NINE protein [Agromyces albus]
MSSERRPSAGWYDDMTDAAVLRYWDGNAWTPHTAPKPADAAPAPLGEVSGVAFESEAIAAPAVGHSMIDAATIDASTIGASTIGSATITSSAIEEATMVRQLPASPLVTAPDGRNPDEHTTVPLPPEHQDGAASGPTFSYDAYRSAGRTFITTWLFALLLGYWGADRFYLGKIGTAILKLVTLGGLGVWVLVDLLLVLFGAQRDRDGRPLEGFEEHKRIAWIVTGGLVGLGIVSAVISGIVAAVVR